jgi:hypothetical protein
LRSPDLVDVAGKAWHVRREELPDRVGNLAFSIMSVPGSNPQGSWFIAILRQYRSRRKFMPTKRTYPLAEMEIMIGILATQPLDMDVPLSNYPRLNPIVMFQQFHGLKVAQAYEIFDSTIRLNISGNMPPSFLYQNEWQMVLTKMIDQMKSEDGKSEVRSV